MIAFNISNPNEVALQIAARVKARRLELDLTQEGLAARAGVKFATYRRFEQTGEISLKGLLLSIVTESGISHRHTTCCQAMV